MRSESRIHDFTRAIPRVHAAGFVTVAVAVVVAGVSAPVVGAPSQAGPPGATVSRCVRAFEGGPKNGAEAVAALGGGLAAVAAKNGTTGRELAAQLSHDGTLWVDECGDLLFRDALPAEGALPAGSLDGSTWTSTIAPADTFALHSRPGSARVLYLDFDGHYVAGTGWNATFSLAPWQAPAFSTDSDPTTFSDAERAIVAEVWQLVSQDYAPFDVDVTTQDPGLDSLDRLDSADTKYGMRVLISPDSATQSQCGCAGQAWVDSFDRTSNGYHQPAWVYPHKLLNTAKYIAEAASHESGHTLGLSHDGTSTDFYYSGANSWGPIMGSPYSKAITQWSDGSYPDANNVEDDISIIAGNGTPLVADEAGGSSSTALPLAMPAAVTGLISERSDVDAFLVSVSGVNALEVSVTPQWPGPDLDASVTVQDLAGKVLASSAPPLDANNIQGSTSASLNVLLAAGTYVISVDGTGNGQIGSVGESDYGSVGWYTLTASDGTTAVAPTPIPATSPSPTPTTSPTPLQSPSATAGPTPAPTATATATPTATSSPSPSPTSTATKKPVRGGGGRK